MTVRHYLAVDLGAESGRVMLGSVGVGRVALEEIHRFANGPLELAGGLRWDLPRLLAAIKAGLRRAAERGLPIAGVSTDAWGVDYVLLRGGEPLAPPFHYRDSRTDAAMERVFARVPADDIFAATGIQFMSLNTLFQLAMDREDDSGNLARADRFLNIGDYFNAALCGVARAETTLASTTQLYDPRAGQWAWDLIARLGLPRGIFPELVPPGTRLGPLLPAVAAETGLRGVEVVAGCSHDTAAAVAAVPAEGGDWAFLSSGTWSLLGVELRAPVINGESRRLNFTNEAGYGGSVLFRKNIVGLWIVQECRRAWAAEGKEYGYDELTGLAARSPAAALIRPDHPVFAKPGDMPGKIAAYCRDTGQGAPQGPGALVRCVLESLALLYAQTLEQCAAASGARIRRLHIVGGGSKNGLLNQLTADAVQMPVEAGPAEATALGNILIQAGALGGDTLGPRVPDRAGEDLRALARGAFARERFRPGAARTEAGERFRALPAGP